MTTSEHPIRMTFDERIGGVLVAPRRTFARLCAGEAHASDIAWLMLFRLIAGEADRLAMCIPLAREIGIGFAVQQALDVTASALLPAIVGVLAVGMVMQLFCRHKRAFDVAAYAYVPYLAVTLVATFYFTLRQYEPSATARHVVEAIGVACALPAWLVALDQARRSPA